MKIRYINSSFTFIIIYLNIFMVSTGDVHIIKENLVKFIFEKDVLIL